MKSILSHLLIIVLISILCSCNKSNITKVNSTGIYSVGESIGGVPIYWLDTVQHELPHLGYGGVASAIYIDELEDDYIAGKINYVDNGGKTISHACYWKNGTLINLGLTDPHKYSFATDILVKDKTVYVSGATENNGVDAASYWINGQLKILPKPSQITGSFKAVSIAVQNNKIYLANNKIGYWTNEVFTTLEGTDVQLDDICIANNKVVASGQTASKAAIWVDGQRTILNVTNRGASYTVGSCMTNTDTWAAVLVYPTNRSVIIRNGQIHEDVSPPGGLNTALVALTLWKEKIYACGSARFTMNGGSAGYHQAFIFYDNQYKLLQGMNAFIYDMTVKE